jgi:fused signal recognition particle receptor
MTVPVSITASVIAACAAVAVYIVLRRRRRLKSRNKAKPLSEGLASTKRSFAGRLGALFTRSSVDGAFIAELEETLLSADVGVPTCEILLDAVKDAESPSHARELLRSRMVALFTAKDEPSLDRKPHVILVLGVNGVGKTTSIAKLAYRYQTRGKRVLLAAGDTFRAAAIEQLEVWGRRLDCDVVAQKMGGDAASVAFDAVAKARARGHDVVLVDTAGRIHTKHNLMEELGKIDRVIAKAYPGAPHERWLVLDATVGQNGLNQARRFHETLGLTGLIVTKLDGTAKGGIVCAVTELGIPVVSIGVGEGMADLKPFEPRAFVDAILGS